MDAKEYLQNLLETKNFSKTLLFIGKSSAEEYALFFAKEILQTNKIAHPDLHIYKPEGKLALHSIASIKSFLEEVYLPPYTSKNKVFILYDADRMLPASANALLKTLEEPALDATIILISLEARALLPTIVSRCQIFDFKERVGVQVSPLKERVVEILAKAKRQGYVELLKSIKAISDALEQKKKLLEKEYKEGLSSSKFLKEFSLVQQEVYQKEVEGYVSLQISLEQEMLLETVLEWYRDLHLLSTKADTKYLIYPNKEVLESVLKSLKFLPELVSIQKEIASAKLALERSSSFQLVFENLLLKLIPA
ncbi:MAG: hypothetical protein P4L16_07595 [Chlamydiales bacterium]|nr:hypothetical protein [Chlamydiales bacterium]